MDSNNSVIKFKVKKSWLTDKGYGRDTVALHRYHENKWNKLETTRYSEDATCYHYSAESPGFSTFAITVEKATAKTAKTKATIKKVLEEEEPEAEENVTRATSRRRASCRSTTRKKKRRTVKHSFDNNFDSSDYNPCNN